MNLATERYADQITRWPEAGKHILAQYDDQTIVVYQAYRPSIAEYVIKRGVFGGDFSYSRMSWIKPNFLWMMYRSGWGTKPGQEVTLGLRLRREFFDEILVHAVASSFDQSNFTSKSEWQAAVNNSDIRLQWDPDHAPFGERVSRRAIQLGMRGSVLEAFGKTELIEVIDMTEFVAKQREHLFVGGESQIIMPIERKYLPNDELIVHKLKLD